MELRGVPGQEARGLAHGEAERTPGSAPSPGEVAPGSLGSAGAAGTRPSTGDARVDEAVARLADLAELPVAEHPAVFEYVHERLTEALGDLDVRDPAGPGGPGGTSGAGGYVPGPPAPGG
jgi:hypothetical protein